MTSAVEFVGKRSRSWLFGAGLSVAVFGVLCIVVPFSEGANVGVDLLFGVFLAGSLAWLAYVLWAPTMRLTIGPETVTSTSRLAPVRIERDAGDLLVFEQIWVGGGIHTIGGIMYWKLHAPESGRGVLLSQWDPELIAETCRSNGWRVEWRDSKGNVLPGPG